MATILGQCTNDIESNQPVETIVLRVTGSGSGPFDGTCSWVIDTGTTFTWTRLKPFSATPSQSQFVLPKSGCCSLQCDFGPDVLSLALSFPNPQDAVIVGTMTVVGGSIPGTYDIYANFAVSILFNASTGAPLISFGIGFFQWTDGTNFFDVCGFVFQSGYDFNPTGVGCNKNGTYPVTDPANDAPTNPSTLTFSLTLS